MRLAHAASALALAVAFALCGADARAGERTLALGVDLPLSGVDGADGVPARNAVLLALEAENRRGFPAGYRVVLSDLDDTVQGKHDPAQGALNFKSLVADSRVLAVIGPMNSNVAKAQIPIANATALAEISMGATAIDLTHPGAAGPPTFFRVCASDDRQGGLLARFALRQGWKRAFVIDDNESYGHGVADLFASSFVRAGGTLLGREHLTPFALDFKPLLTKIAALHPEALFFGGIVSTGGGVIRKQMGDAGLGEVPFLGGDGLDSPEFVPLAGAAAEGTYFSMTAPDISHLASARAFVRDYRARFRTEPDAYAPGAYSAALVALEAIRARLVVGHGRPTREAVRAAIAATNRLATPIGPIAFDRFGDLRHPTLSIYRIAAGKAHFVLQSSAP